jgi:hypothetical protein
VNIEAKEKMGKKYATRNTNPQKITLDCIYALAPSSCVGVTSLWSPYAYINFKNCRDASNISFFGVKVICESIYYAT